MLKGFYEEYFDDGTKKLFGQYDIFERYQPTDSIYHIVYETYEEILEVVEGDFWKPVSLKTGRWYAYDKNGKLVSIKNETPEFNESLRNLPFKSEE